MNLHQLWHAQADYNERVRDLHHVETGKVPTREEWTQTFLLGLISEVNEVLQEIQWKVHARNAPMGPTMSNLAVEFADLTKYIMCLWQLWDFTADDMLFWVEEKTALMDFRLRSEGKEPVDSNVIVCDLDGTITDWRAGFIQWLNREKHVVLRKDPRTSLMFDVDMGIPYEQYNAWKNEFERTGGYTILPVYKDAIALLTRLQAERNACLVIVTARPLGLARVLMDTLHWLRSSGLEPYSIRLVEAGRVQYAMELAKRNKVVLLEDDPVLIARAAHNKIPVLVRAEPYNASVKGTSVLVMRTNDFMEGHVLRGFDALFGGKA